MLQTWASGFTRTELYVANLGLRIYKERTICGKPVPQDSHSLFRFIWLRSVFIVHVNIFMRSSSCAVNIVSIVGERHQMTPE